MSRQGRSGSSGFWGSLFGAAPMHPRFSLEELQYLHSVLLKNPVVGDANRDTVVEALRSIAELVIWGDQHDSGMVEYFLTENLLGHFNQILQQRSNRRGNVAMQVLQTLSILIQNLRTQQTLYYLFSNNHINEIVSMRFDFEDDEVLGYYVNLLKTISLKLNEVTVQFFFQAAGPRSPGAGSATRPASFPLYTESIKFVNHRDPMVRTAVKTLTLNVYGIPLPAVQQFVASPPAATYFIELATYVAEQCQVLDRLLSSWDVTSPQAPGSVEGCLAEVEDLLSYCNDVLMTGVAPLRDLLLDCLWQAFVGPVLFWPLIQEDVAAQHIAALTLGGGNGGSAGSAGALAAAAGSASGGRALPEANAAGAGRTVQRGAVGPLCSLYVFERLFRAVTDQQLLTELVSALLGGTAACIGSSGGDSGGASRPGSPERQHRQQAASAAAAAAAPRWQISQALLARLQYSPAAYRQALLSMLRGSDAQVAAAAVRVLAALLQSRAVSEEELELIGLLPQRRRKQRQLLQVLVGDSSPLSSQVMELAAAGAGWSQQQGGRCKLAHAPAEQQQEQQQEGSPVGAIDSVQACNGSLSRRSNSGSSSNGSSSRGGGDGSSGLVQLSLSELPDGSVVVHLQSCSPMPAPQQQQSQQQQGDQQPPAAQHPQHSQRQQQQAALAAAHAEQQFSDIVSALLGLLVSDLLPPLSLGVVGWLLNQLLSTGKGGAALAPAQAETLSAAAARQRAALQQQLQGLWCDALAPLVAAEWGRSRLAILRAGPGSVHIAVQTWMQAVLVQELRWQQGAAVGGPGGSDPAAVAAKHAYLTVQAAVSVLQLQQVLDSGSIPADPPCPAFGEADVRRGEVREQAQIALGQSQRMQCSVCFTRGQERQAYFAVEGLPAHVKAGVAPDLTLLKPSVLQQLASAAPVLLVAEQGSKPETGLVLSVAPLMGAAPRVDERHARWLHVEVRPPLRGLLKVLAASHPGNALLALQKHLVSGHWVLSFPDADRAASAQQHAEEWAHKMRAVYCQLLHPLLEPPSNSGGGGSSGEGVGGEGRGDAHNGGGAASGQAGREAGADEAASFAPPEAG